jgi:hypothetical protein
MRRAYICTHPWCWARRATGHGLTGSSEREFDYGSPTVNCHNADHNHSWPKMMYTDQGHQLCDRLWDETLEELKFAGVKEKLQKDSQLDKF